MPNRRSLLVAAGSAAVLSLTSKKASAAAPPSTPEEVLKQYRETTREVRILCLVENHVGEYQFLVERGPKGIPEAEESRFPAGTRILVEHSRHRFFNPEYCRGYYGMVKPAKPLTDVGDSVTLIGVVDPSDPTRILLKKYENHTKMWCFGLKQESPWATLRQA